MSDAAETPVEGTPEGADTRSGPTGGECLNCGAKLDGRFCSACGQRRVDGPLRTTEIVRDLCSHALDVDRGFLHTFVGMTLRPGATALEYVDGRRQRHTPPFRYFLILMAAWLAFPALIGFDYGDYVARSMSEMRKALEHSPPEIAGAMEKFMAASEEMYGLRRWAVLANLPLFAIGGLLLFRRRRRTFAEWFAFSLYISGHSLLLVIVGIVFLTFKLDVAFQLVSFLLLPYLIWAYRGFSGDSVGMSILKGCAVFFIGGVLVLCGLFSIGLAMAW